MDPAYTTPRTVFDGPALHVLYKSFDLACEKAGLSGANSHAREILAHFTLMSFPGGHALPDPESVAARALSTYSRRVRWPAVS